MRTNLIKTKELPKVVEPSTTDGMLDMVIAFDTTGSMSAYINAVKTHVKELVPKLFSSNPDLRIGIVAFGDYCDMKAPTLYGKAYQVLDLTNDENKIIKFINEAQNTSGGDGDEFYELVIKKITEETAWREGSTKAVLLIADAAKKFAEELIKNPILPYEEGEDRVLRGFKIQFESRDGRYNCIDMDIEDTNNVRPVNINTIRWIILGGTKYVVE